MTDIRANRFVGERNHLEVRTTDPTTTQEGELWIRSDIAPDTLQIGTLRFDNGGTVLDVPIYLNGSSDSNVSEALRVKVNQDIGFIPTLPATDATFSELRFRHNGGTLAFHDVPQLASAFFDIQNLSTNSPVTEGENLNATFDISNTGEKDATQTIELLNIAGSVVDSNSETIAEGASVTGKQLTWGTSSGDAGNGDITVQSQDDLATATVDIQQGTAIPDSVEAHMDFYYPLNEGSGQQLSDAIGDVSGSVNGGSWGSDSNFDTVLSYQDGDSSGASSDFWINQSNVSIGFWLKYDTFHQYQRFFLTRESSGSDRTQLRLDRDNESVRLDLYPDNDELLRDSTPYPTNTWLFHTITLDGSNTHTMRVWDRSQKIIDRSVSANRTTETSAYFIFESAAGTFDWAQIMAAQTVVSESDWIDIWEETRP